LFAVAAVAGMVLLSKSRSRFATQFSEAAFRSIKVGAQARSVLAQLGPPLAEFKTRPFTAWVYSDRSQDDFATHGECALNGSFTIVEFDTNGVVRHVGGQLAPTPGRILMGVNYLGLTTPDIVGLLGVSSNAVVSRFGNPRAVYDYRPVTILQYSKSADGGSYERRDIGIGSDGRVVQIWDEFYED